MGTGIAVSYGFSGTVDEAQWADFWVPTMDQQGHVIGADVSVGAGAREVDVAVGHFWAAGIHAPIAATTLTAATNTSGNPRIDTVVVNIDWSSDDAGLQIVQGAPGVSPIPPALTQDAGTQWQLPLANLYLPSGYSAILESNIGDRRPFADGRIVGEEIMYGGSTAPSRWLVCDGSAVSRFQYAALFEVLGTSCGAGNGSTTFNLPDLRDRVPMGGGTLGNKAGADSDTITLATANIPGHTHTINHDHPSTATSSDTHQHTYQVARADGFQDGTFRSGDGGDSSVKDFTGNGTNGILPDTHTHTVNLPNYSGSSGSTGSGESFTVDTVPSHQRRNFIIYTGVE